jgi:hypothetical protein
MSGHSQFEVTAYHPPFAPVAGISAAGPLDAFDMPGSRLFDSREETEHHVQAERSRWSGITFSIREVDVEDKK